MKKMIIELDPNEDIEKLDWNMIKTYGAFGVMIPLGDADYYGRVTANSFVERCMEAAAENNLAVGVTVNIRCKDPFSAHEAAYNTVEIIKGYRSSLSLGIAYGLFERKRSCLIEQGKDGLTDTALSLLFETERLGYSGVLYTDFIFADTYMDIERIKGRRFWGEENKKWNEKLLIRTAAEADKNFIIELKHYKQNILYAKA